MHYFYWSRRGEDNIHLSIHPSIYSSHPSIYLVDEAVEDGAGQDAHHCLPVHTALLRQHHRLAYRSSSSSSSSSRMRVVMVMRIVMVRAGSATSSSITADGWVAGFYSRCIPMASMLACTS